MYKNLGLIVSVIIGVGVLALILILFINPQDTAVPNGNGTTTENGTGIIPPPPPPPNSEDEPDTLTVGIGLIALEDAGASGREIGCEDSVVLVDLEIPYTTGTLRAALERLLSIEDTQYGQSGLYNAFANSNLILKDVAIDDAVATIELSGQLSLGGVCDNPRVQAQLEETALQFDTVESVEIFVNGEPIEEVLSLQ